MHASRKRLLATLITATGMGCAQAAPQTYLINGTASGDITGPINGTISLDLSQVAMTQTSSLADGSTELLQKEEFSFYDGEWGLIDWQLAGEHRQAGSFDAPTGATISRSLLADGSSTLTLDTSAAFAHGAMGYQHFTLTYTSQTDELFTHADQLPPLEHISSASGRYDFAYAPSYYDPLVQRSFSFTVNTSNVPEPDVMGLAVAGLLPLACRAWLRRPN